MSQWRIDPYMKPKKFRRLNRRSRKRAFAKGLTVPVCIHCKKAIIGMKVIRLGDDLYHPNCYRTHNSESWTGNTGLKGHQERDSPNARPGPKQSAMNDLKGMRTNLVLGEGREGTTSRNRTSRTEGFRATDTNDPPIKTPIPPTYRHDP